MSFGACRFFELVNDTRKRRVLQDLTNHEGPRLRAPVTKDSLKPQRETRCCIDEYHWRQTGIDVLREQAGPGRPTGRLPGNNLPVKCSERGNKAIQRRMAEY
jgi:hypothetical protein